MSTNRHTWWRHQWKHFPRYWPFVREFPGPGEVPAQRPVTRSFDVFFYDWVNNREAGDLRRHRGHYDVNVMVFEVVHFKTTTISYANDMMQLLNPTKKNTPPPPR